MKPVREPWWSRKVSLKVRKARRKAPKRTFNPRKSKKRKWKNFPQWKFRLGKVEWKTATISEGEREGARVSENGEGRGFAYVLRPLARVRWKSKAHSSRSKNRTKAKWRLFCFPKTSPECFPASTLFFSFFHWGKCGTWMNELWMEGERKKRPGTPSSITEKLNEKASQFLIVLASSFAIKPPTSYQPESWLTKINLSPLAVQLEATCHLVQLLVT